MHQKNHRNLRIPLQFLVKSQIPERYFHGGRREPSCVACFFPGKADEIHPVKQPLHAGILEFEFHHFLHPFYQTQEEQADAKVLCDGPVKGGRIPMMACCSCKTPSCGHIMGNMTGGKVSSFSIKKFTRTSISRQIP